MTRAAVLPAEKVVERLKMARRALGYNQATLSVLADLPFSTINNLERGRRVGVYLHELLALSKALEIDVRDLLTDQPIDLTHRRARSV